MCAWSHIPSSPKSYVHCPPPLPLQNSSQHSERLSLGYFQVGSNKIFHCFLRVTVDFFHQCQSCGLRHSAPSVTQSSFTYMERIITLNINVPLNHLRNLVKIQIFMTKSLRSGSRFCISNNFPDNAKAASLIIKFCGIRS